jgi:hypothetical protein
MGWPDMPFNPKTGTIFVKEAATSSKTLATGVLGGYVYEYKGKPVYAAGECVIGSSLLVTCGKAGIDLAALMIKKMTPTRQPRSRIDQKLPSPELV